MELQPILERRLKSFDFIFNPVFARVAGQHVDHGWGFEPALRAAYGDSDQMRVVPYVEWYSNWARYPAWRPSRARSIRFEFEFGRHEPD